MTKPSQSQQRLGEWGNRGFKSLKNEKKKLRVQPLGRENSKAPEKGSGKLSKKKRGAKKKGGGQRMKLDRLLRILSLSFR